MCLGFSEDFMELCVQRVYIVQMCVAEGLHSMSEQPSDPPQVLPQLGTNQRTVALTQCHCAVVCATLTPPPFLACGTVHCFQYCTVLGCGSVPSVEGQRVASGLESTLHSVVGV